MTVDQEWTEGPSHKQDQTPPDIIGLYPEHPLHVKSVNTQNERVAPEFTGWDTWSIIQAGQGNATQLCQRRYHRYKAKIVWNIPAATTVWLDNKPDSLTNPVPPATKGQLTGPLVNWVMPDYDGQQPLYATFTGAGPVTALVIDESYGTVQ